VQYTQEYHCNDIETEKPFESQLINVVEDESFSLDLDENFKSAMDLVIDKMKVKDIKFKNFLHRPGKDGN